jgi:16S rRNA C967 or C1407 C5-methylase (RsmB/RsmF family)
MLEHPFELVSLAVNLKYEPGELEKTVRFRPRFSSTSGMFIAKLSKSA